MKVGEHDTAGNMLRLSGTEASVFREPDGGYLLKTKEHSVPYLFVEDVLAAYNEINGTYYSKLPKIYRKLETPFKVPSSRNRPGKPEIEYTVTQLPESMTLVCDCPGFGYRRTCKHVEFLDEFLSEKEQSNLDEE
jgi:hypothetical protein